VNNRLLKAYVAEIEIMDRLDAMAAFVATADEGGLAAAARRLGRSPAAITRAIAALEQRTGVRLLHRTTRVVRLTEAGERYLATCRRVIADLEEADVAAAGERTVPRGLLTVTAPALFGRLHVRALVDAFLDANPQVQAHLLLLDRVVDVIDEGIDIAVRIGELPDSSLVAVKVGQLRRVICAAPAYLARYPAIRTPADLAGHDCIGFSQVTPTVIWSFKAGARTSGRGLQVKMRPRLTVNGAEAAVASAVEGHGLVCMLSYQVEDAVRAGQLNVLLEAYEPSPPPIHIVYPEGRMSAAKARAFVDLAVPKLRARFAAV
jgi:DNA-binding transcriptional LysR family regulator